MCSRVRRTNRGHGTLTCSVSLHRSQVFVACVSARANVWDELQYNTTTQIQLKLEHLHPVRNRSRFLQVCCLLSAILYCVAKSFRNQGQYTSGRSKSNGQTQPAISSPLLVETPCGTKQGKPEGRRLRSHSANRPRGARASTQISATRYNPSTPEEAATLSVGQSFEGAITRLAGAVGLGTEKLIYVRRADIEEVVDALLRQAGTPGGLSVASPVLERLAIVRQSARSEGRRGTASGPRSKRASSVDRRNLFATFDGDNNGERRARRSRNFRSCRTPPPRPRTSLESFSDNKMMLTRTANFAGAATTHTSDIIPALNCSRSRSPVSVRTMDDTAARRRCTGWSGGDQRRSRQTRSPPPQAPPSPALTSTSSGESPTRVSAATVSAFFGTPATKISRAEALAESRFKVYAAAAAAASKSKLADCEEYFPSTTPSPAGGGAKKLSFVPITPRAAEEGASPRAFDDFWSSGLMD